MDRLDYKIGIIDQLTKIKRQHSSLCSYTLDDKDIDKLEMATAALWDSTNHLYTLIRNYKYYLNIMHQVKEHAAIDDAKIMPIDDL